MMIDCIPPLRVLIWVLCHTHPELYTNNKKRKKKRQKLKWNKSFPPVIFSAGDMDDVLTLCSVLCPYDVIL